MFRPEESHQEGWAVTAMTAPLGEDGVLAMKMPLGASSLLVPQVA